MGVFWSRCWPQYSPGRGVMLNRDDYYSWFTITEETISKLKEKNLKNINKLEILVNKEFVESDFISELKDLNFTTGEIMKIKIYSTQR